MFGNVLIVNRGEIACRIQRTARALGIRSLSVFSAADRGALFTRTADEAHELGVGGYLDGANILALAKQLGAEALHPGYGFLAENADFAQSCADAGVVFIGPSANAMRALGRKSDAKALMQKAGAPIVPGYFGADQNEARLRSEADAIGYPVLIKAVAGGGGRGMRRVDRGADFGAALASARREALNAFGDSQVLLEKYLTRSRHVEVQVFGDNYGAVVALGERDCSVQRRSQKIIEESPAPGLPEVIRAAMAKVAVNAASAVAYAGAGTVEFIADTSEGYREDRFYFMEMNTRLQVEHPVTEMRTGLDLVEWQFRIAAGEPLPLRQHQIQGEGSVMEARLCAENPQAEFLPSPGRLYELILPEGPGVRVDSGFATNDAVSGDYDSLLAKIIVRSPDRAETIRRLRRALQETRVVGPSTNRNFLIALLETPEFLAGNCETQFVDRNLAALTPPWPALDATAIVAGAQRLFAREAAALGQVTSNDPWGVADSFELTGRRRGFGVLADGARVDFEAQSENGTTRWIIAAPQAASPAPLQDIKLYETPESILVYASGRQFEVAPDIGRSSSRAPSAGAAGLEAPMPGRILDVFVKEGQVVEAGQIVAVLEAMKMEHRLAAPRSGQVRGLTIAVGDRVALGSLLMSIEAASSPQPGAKPQ